MTALARRLPHTLAGLALGAMFMLMLLALGARIVGADALDAGTVTVPAFIDAGIPLDAGEPAAVAIPDPVESPAESAGLLYKLYKAGHLVPMAIVFAFFALGLASRWIAWLKVGWRRLVVSSLVGGFTMIVERAASGETPNMLMLAGAIGATLTLYMQGKGSDVDGAA